MVRSTRIILFFVLFGFLASDNSGTRLEPEPNVCMIPLTQVLRLRVSTLGAQEVPESLNPPIPTLMLSPGASDEIAEGPAGFDVFDDGSLLITDPLRGRLCLFNSQGEFRMAWKIGFAADSLTVVPNGIVLVREASTGKLYAFNREGRARPLEGVSMPEQAEARVLTPENGTVSRPAIGSAPGGPLSVQLNKPGATLLSLEGLVTDQKGDTYVALETTASGRLAETIDLNKYVRRYSSDGKLLCETAGIPLDYYVPPVDELRVHKGKVYQLQTTSSEVRINVWDTNQLCAHPSH